MPLYDFHCSSCNSTTEKLSSYEDSKNAQICSNCGKDAFKVFSGSVGLDLRGSGFYVNDYKKVSKSE